MNRNNNEQNLINYRKDRFYYQFYKIHLINPL
jgi:hypothetical protein